MIIARSPENPNVYELHFLGLKVSGFAQMEDTKFNASEFAVSEYQILGDLIRGS